MTLTAKQADHVLITLVAGLIFARKLDGVQVKDELNAKGEIDDLAEDCVQIAEMLIGASVRNTGVDLSNDDS